MFADHQGPIARYALSGPDQFQDTLNFVYLTIQQGLWTVPAAMHDVRRLGAESRFAWGMKAAGIAYVTQHKAALYADTLEIAAIANPEWQRHEALNYFAMLPGLGMVKAGFVCQLILGQVGCIDTHNLARFDLARPNGEQPAWLKASTYKAAKPGKRQALRDSYLALVDNAGGAEGLWDSWCSYVAERDKAHYSGPEHVSRLHVEAIIG